MEDQKLTILPNRSILGKTIYGIAPVFEKDSQVLEGGLRYTIATSRLDARSRQVYFAPWGVRFKIAAHSSLF
jgi:hypothetical protein